MNANFKHFSAENCVAILKKKLKITDFTIESFKFVPFGIPKGFLGDHATLTIEYCQNGENKSEKFFAKSNPNHVSFYKDFIVEGRMFFKEVAFYQDLIGEMLENGVEIVKDCVPTCYSARSGEYLILEDLVERGYKTEDHRVPLKMDFVKLGLAAMAKLHCSALVYEEIMKIKTGSDFKLGDVYPEMFRESFFADAPAAIRLTDTMKRGAITEIELTRDDRVINSEILTKLILEYIDRIREIIRPSKLYRNTICHGDIWLSNVMFKSENSKPNHACIVDFQNFRYAPPAQDFMFFMYLSTDREFRRECMRDMIEFYYREMCDIFKGYHLNPEEILPYEEFINSCNHYRIYGCLLALNHNPVICIPPELLKSMFADVSAVADMIFKDRSPVIRKCWMECEKYRSKIRESIANFVDLFTELKLL